MKIKYNDLSYIDKTRHQILIDYIKRTPIFTFHDDFYHINKEFSPLHADFSALNLNQAFEIFKKHVRSMSECHI